MRTDTERTEARILFSYHYFLNSQFFMMSVQGFSDSNPDSEFLKVLQEFYLKKPTSLLEL